MNVYVLRNCRMDMTSYNDFVWPESGFVKCPDWNSTLLCGNGLHGFLWGKGNPTLFYKGNCNYLIVEVDENLIVDLGDKVKFPQGNVVFCTTDKYAAGAKMLEFGADPATCMFARVTTGDDGISVTDYYGISTSGDRGNSTSGDRGNSTSGDRGNSTSGNGGTSISGHWGTSISGHWGYSSSGNWGTSTSGHWGTSASDKQGTSTSGNGGTSISGWGGTVQTGIGGRCRLMHYTEETGYIRKFLTDPKPNVKYQLNDNGEFVEVS